MKKCFSTVCCQDLNYKEIADIAAEAGINALEVRLHQGNRLFDLADEDVERAVSYLDEKNIKIVSLGTGVGLVDYDTEVIETAKKCVLLASCVGAKGIRVFLGTGIKRFSEVTEYSYDGIVKALVEICAFANCHDVEIRIETHNEFSTGKVLKTLISDVGYDNLKVIWDIIHPIEFGESPAETMEYIGNRIVHVHIKDGLKKEDPDEIFYRYTKLGEGVLPIFEIVDLLEKNGYDGYYSLEWENAWKDEIKDTFSSLGEILEHFNNFI